MSKKQTSNSIQRLDQQREEEENYNDPLLSLQVNNLVIEPSILAM